MKQAMDQATSKLAPLAQSFAVGSIVFCFCYLTGLSETSAQANVIDWPKIRFQGAIQELPVELANGIPFGLENSYLLDEASNREQAYLQIFVRYGSALFSQRGLESSYPTGSNFYKSRDFRKGYVLQREHQKRLTELMRNDLRKLVSQGTRKGVPAKVLKDAEKRVASLDPVFKGLLQTQQERDACFFHRGVATVGEVTFPAGFFADTMQLRYALSPDNPRSIEELGATLKLLEDTRILASHFGQLFGRSCEQKCFDNVVKRMLVSRKQSPAELDQLIKVLLDFRESKQRIDPALEAARRYYLLSRQVLLLLQDGKYQIDPNLPQPDSLKTQGDAILFLLRTMSHDLRNETLAIRLKNRWTKSNRSQQEIDQVLEFAKLLERSGSGGNPNEAMTLQNMKSQLLAAVTNAHTNEDFQRDLQVLATRYDEIESACKLPFPQSTEQLKKLSVQWTLANKGQDSAILMWCTPEPMSSRAQSVLMVNAYLCLAAIKKWRMDHDGDNPRDLESALANVGADEAALDPFSGKPLLMKVMDSIATIYSVGFDGKDQKGKSTSRRSTSTEFPYTPLSGADLPGDIVFTIDF